MFTILGADGKEYGPATAQQIRGWIAAGRANLDTQAKAAGSEEWRRLGDYPEFSAPEITPVLAVADSDLAGRWIRLLAKLLDEVCSLACALPGMAMIGLSTLRDMLSSAGNGSFGGMEDAHNLAGFGVMVLGVFALSIVQIWLISTRGQTIGKYAFGARIVRVTDNSLPGFVHGWFLRSFVPGVIGFAPFGLGVTFSLLDICFIFRRDRRCIHDFIAGTRVVKVSSE